jgi:acetoin:2,6-dichlorophenolindophenol oxidoreductase subunit alpha
MDLRATDSARASFPAAPEGDETALLLTMSTIREFEIEVQKLFAKGLLRATTHLYQGQEAVATGACASLKAGDTMTCTYRGHGAVLAMGVSLSRAFGELLGRQHGLCGGKGGSMHLTDVQLGVMGSNGIVGAHLPIANGLAFAARYRRTDAVSLCFFGDGATNIGAFHEAMNLAGVWRLPVLFVCENNLYGEYSPVLATTPISRLADRAASYGMPGVQVDGNDVLAVRETMQAAVARARSGAGPSLIEALTYRIVGHSRSDPGAYRPAGELDSWIARDPIKRSEERLRAGGVAAETLEQIRKEALRRVAAASEEARTWPTPAVEALHSQVYA